MPTRYFAREALDNMSSPVVEFPSAEAVDERGGGGDELRYNPETDTFTCDDRPGVDVPNPVAGNPLLGASFLIEELEATAADHGPQGLFAMPGGPA